MARRPWRCLPSAPWWFPVVVRVRFALASSPSSQAVLAADALALCSAPTLLEFFSASPNSYFHFEK